MWNRRLNWLGLFLMVTILTHTSCGMEDSERAIRQLIEKAAGLAEAHDVGGIMELTTDDFVADPGELDGRESKRILWMAFKHYGKLKVLYPRPSIGLESDERKAWASVPFLIVKKEGAFPKLQELYDDPQGWMEEVGEAADLYRFKLQLVRLNGAWLVQRVLLEKFRGLGFNK